jgi:hypothetical protein
VHKVTLHLDETIGFRLARNFPDGLLRHSEKLRDLAAPQGENCRGRITPYKIAAYKIAAHQRRRNRSGTLLSISCGGAVLPDLTEQGDLPPGVHLADWNEFRDRFCGASPRRVWLFGRLQALLELAGTNGKLRRAFIWGSFVTAKPAPRDLDILLIMDEDFEVDGMSAPAQAVFDAVRAKLLFESDVFWARSSIGRELLDLWLETYQTSRGFRKRGIVELELR